MTTIPYVTTGADQLLTDQQAQINRYHHTLREIQLGTTDQMVHRVMDLEDQVIALQARLEQQAKQHETDIQAMQQQLAEQYKQLVEAEHQHALMEVRAEKTEQRCSALFFLKERWQQVAFADELTEMIQGCNWLVDALQAAECKYDEARGHAYDFADAALHTQIAFRRVRSLVLNIAAADAAGFGLDSELRDRLHTLAITLKQSAAQAKQE